MTGTPCIDICTFDGRSGQCEGCGRTRPEIAGWRKLSPYQKRTIERDLPRRLARLSANLTPKPTV
ncbi:MAG: DUF1289 domain-containing protein [Brevundimonas aurantiaca]|jgi:uncharacterized protein|uniref:DUF1289 domain-containing protein n=3 Tax=Brevundimonas TaxID=41275 RepID=A0A4Y9S0U5_9CAUL|nr:MULTISPECIES: DUF1289 domain-containing protein [Brevundimonas]MBU1385864.1 DUF1289 domain-containing protein [Alphaproteobacteria bacterium]MEA3474079.1 DUF1289 domain-containing protein [Pseudomonadota bacterium]OYW90075.1 MAG: DUF1289 domain-containing protein [Pseudomonadales bacterium 32-61-5]MBJ7317543.1 DUF1289 domain-containing protein [Brevundimonas sp.]MBU2269979.1 DUF1289 domain-containing protein [Alphaproteobacteria bacterium]